MSKYKQKKIGGHHIFFNFKRGGGRNKFENCIPIIYGMIRRQNCNGWMWKQCSKIVEGRAAFGYHQLPSRTAIVTQG